MIRRLSVASGFLLIVLFGFYRESFAGYTEYNSGYIGQYDVKQSSGSLTIAKPDGWTRNDSIISVTLRYRKQDTVYRDGSLVVTSKAFPGSSNIYSVLNYAPVTSASWSSPTVYPVPDSGHTAVELHCPDTRVLVEITNIRYRRYNTIDEASLSINNNGNVNVTIKNSTPNRWLKYVIVNNVIGTRTELYGESSTINWEDTSALSGKGYNYSVYWGFPWDTGAPGNNYSVFMSRYAGEIFVPIDHQLTEKVNAISNNTRNAYGSAIDAVRDASGTVLSEARQAKNNSQNAGTYALNAYNTAQTVNTKIDNLSTAVTNIQNSMGADTSPPVIDITTVSGALATSGGSIRAVINASDNISALFEYSLDGAVYHPLPTDGAVNLPVINTGTNLITVWVKDEAGNVGRDSISIRKLGM